MALPVVGDEVGEILEAARQPGVEGPRRDVEHRQHAQGLAAGQADRSAGPEADHLDDVGLEDRGERVVFRQVLDPDHLAPANHDIGEPGVGAGAALAAPGNLAGTQDRDLAVGRSEQGHGHAHDAVEAGLERHQVDVVVENPLVVRAFVRRSWLFLVHPPPGGSLRTGP